MSAAPLGPDRSDESLFAAFARHGDAAALGELFCRRAGELVRLAATRTATRGDAEDLVQATFVTAMRDASSFDSTRRVMPWLRGILENHARHERRRRRRCPPPKAERSEPEPLATMLRQEVRHAFERELGQLRPPYREVLDLHVFHELDSGEIAARLGRTPVTVRQQLSRGFGMLRRVFPIGFVLALADRRARAQSTHPAPRAQWAAAGPWAALAAVAALALWTLPSNPVVPGSASTLPSEAPPPAPIAAGTSAATTKPMPTPTFRQPADTTGRLQLAVARRDGTPAAGVRVQVVPAGDEPPAVRAAVARQVTTDAAGLATVDGLPPGEHHLGAIETTATFRVHVAAGSDTAAALTVDGPFAITGTVTDAADRPLAGATVFVSDSAGRHDASTPVAVSDATGTFTYSSAAPAPKLFARGVGHADSPGVRATDAPLRLRLRGPDRSLQVVVVDAAGAALAGAFVAAVPHQEGLLQVPVQHAFTGADGACTFRHLDHDGGAVVVRHRGLAPCLLALAPGSEPAHLRVAMQRGGTIRGALPLTEATPRPVRVFASPAIPDTLGAAAQLLQCLGTPRADGTFELRDVPAGTTLLRVLQENRSTAMQRQDLPTQLAVERVDVVADTIVDVAPRLAPVAAVRGRLRHADGSTAADWTIRAVAAHRRGTRHADLLAATATTDRDGHFTLVGLDPTVDHELHCHAASTRASDTVWFPSASLRLAAGESQPVDLWLPRTTSGSVLLFGADPAATVTLTQARTRTRVRMPLRPDGAHGSPTVPSGDYLVEIHSARHGLRVLPCHSELGTTVLHAPPPSPASHPVLVVDASAGPVFARLLDEHGVEHGKGSGTSTIALGVLAPGRYTLRTFGPGIAADCTEVALTPGPQQLRVTATPSHLCTLRFPFRADENPFTLPPSLSLTVRDERGRVLLQETVRARADGEFVLGVGLAAGSHSIDAETSWGAHVHTTLQVPEESVAAPWTARLGLAH